MPRILLRLTLARAVPPPVIPRPGGEVVTPFGRWVRERVASAALDWQGVAVHHVHLTPATVELVLLTDGAVPPLPSALTIARSLARELDLAARRGGWVRTPLWGDLGVWVAARGADLRTEH